MKITRTIPERKETIEILWVKPFITYATYRNAREQCGMSLMKTCFWCRSKFVDSSETWLVSIEKKGNKLFCQSCAGELQKTPPTEQL